MKRIYIIFSIIIILGISGYLYIRYSALKSKDFKPDNSKANSFLDLRPAIIAKLQQLVKDGSDGLYKLSIEKIQPHILKSQLDMLNAAIIPDTVAIKKLDSTHKLPDDIFKISFSSLHIDGIDIDDLLSGDHLSLKGVSIHSPAIEVYHQKRWYNKEKRENDSVTLYKKIMKKMKSISIDRIEVTNGTVVNNNFSKRNNTSRFNDVTIKMQNVLIDSSTQFDRNRFLFAKQAELSSKNFSGKTPDNLYHFKCETISVSTAENNLTLLQFQLHPRGGKQQFESRLTARKEMYDIEIPKITLSNINWWQLTNEESVIAKEAVINNCSFKVFLDRSLPFRKVKQHNFPHQMLMRIPLPIYIGKMHLVHSNLSYSEYNPGMAKRGTIYIDDMNGQVTNITNMPGKIKLNKLLTLKSTGRFMHTVPVTNGFQFDLSKYKTGNFTMSLDIGAMDSAVLNPIAEPMGEFMIKKGIIRRGIAHVKGNNFKATGRGVLLYKNLYLVALKKNKDKPGGIKKRSVLSFIGNVFLIKNANPSKGDEPRYKNFSSERGPHTTFMSLVWRTIYIGVLKTIGLPEEFADKPY